MRDWVWLIPLAPVFCAGCWQLTQWMDAGIRRLLDRRAHVADWKRITFSTREYSISIIVDANTELGTLALLYRPPRQTGMA